MNYLKEGTEILCPQCETVMLRAKIDIFPGTVVGPDKFEQVEFRGGPGSECLCPKCGGRFGISSSNGNKLFTREGWK